MQYVVKTAIFFSLGEYVVIENLHSCHKLYTSVCHFIISLHFHIISHPNDDVNLFGTFPPPAYAIKPSLTNPQKQPHG